MVKEGKKKQKEVLRSNDTVSNNKQRIPAGICIFLEAQSRADPETGLASAIAITEASTK